MNTGSQVLYFAVVLAVPAVAAAGPTRADAERDLVLDMKLVGGNTVEGGVGPEVTLGLANRSKKAAYRAVLPGDGSDQKDWREPSIYYTAERQGADQSWQNVPP